MSGRQSDNATEPHRLRRRASSLPACSSSRTPVRARPRRLSALSFPTVNPFCMALLYGHAGRAGRSTAQNGGFRGPGSLADGSDGLEPERQEQRVPGQPRAPPPFSHATAPLWSAVKSFSRRPVCFVWRITNEICRGTRKVTVPVPVVTLPVAVPGAARPLAGVHARQGHAHRAAGGMTTPSLPRGGDHAPLPAGPRAAVPALHQRLTHRQHGAPAPPGAR